jgi:hypothetical protein
MTPQSYIAHYRLQPHPEGGYYREVFRSRDNVRSPSVGQERAAMTHIFFLLLEGQISRFHSVRHEELWHFYAGAPLSLKWVSSEGSAEETILSPPPGLPSQVIPAHAFQAANTLGAFSFVGCTVAPGFDYADFFFWRDQPKAEAKLSQIRADWLSFL